MLRQVRDVTAKLAEYEHDLRDKLAMLQASVAKSVPEAASIVEDLGADLAPRAVGARIPTLRCLEIAAMTLPFASELE